ncbi:hypothetical protein IMZ48_24810 [Candidatus Bathyarchaeota archaeon]|nr:hypothetical protein [Candidatus Bathyarchaeota archaeon]
MSIKGVKGKVGSSSTDDITGIKQWLTLHRTSYNWRRRSEALPGADVDVA